MTAESAEAGGFDDSGVNQVAIDPDQAPYVHDSSSAAGTAHLVDKAYESAKRWWDVADSLRAVSAAAGADPESPLVQELILAVSYALRVEHGVKVGCELRPCTLTEDFAWPPRISGVAPDVVALWRDVAGLSKHAAAQARFADLLFERRDGVVRDRAVAAVNAYLAAARSRPVADLDVSAFLVRAWDLARRIRAWELLADVCSELAVQASTAMSSTPPAGPGVVLPMLAALAAKPARAQADRAPDTMQNRVAVIALLDTAFRTYAAGYNASQIASMMRMQTDEPAEIEAIDRREVGAYLAEAAASSGLAKQSHLQVAIRIARDRGLTDLARQATATLQAIPVKDLGLRRSYSSIRVPPDHIERCLDAFTISAQWRDGMSFFLNTDCPLGEIEALRRQERDIAKVAVFASTITHTILGGDGLPRWTPATDEERQAERLATHARIRAENQGRILAEGLQRLAGRYGVPGESELAAFLSVNGRSDEALALSLARSFRHFWSGDYQSCVHLIVPKVEAAARALLLELDEGIYRAQLAKDPGQYPGLFVLLKELERLALDESWAYFLNWFFLGPAGMNIRNEVAHGFVGEINPTYAALTLRAAAMLITVVPPRPPSAASNAEAINQPVKDLTELPRPDRDDLLLILRRPVRDPVSLPGREGAGGRLAALGAGALRITATALQQIARQLDQ